MHADRRERRTALAGLRLRLAQLDLHRFLGQALHAEEGRGTTGQDHADDQQEAERDDTHEGDEVRLRRRLAQEGREHEPGEDHQTDVRPHHPEGDQPDHEPDHAPTAPSEDGSDADGGDPQPEHHPRLLPDARRPVEERRQEQHEQHVPATVAFGDADAERPPEEDQPEEAEPREHEEPTEPRRAEDRVHDPGQDLDEAGADHLPELDVELPPAEVLRKLLPLVVVPRGVGGAAIDRVRDVVPDQRCQQLGDQGGHDDRGERTVALPAGDAQRDRHREQHQERCHRQRLEHVDVRVEHRHHDQRRVDDATEATDADRPRGRARHRWARDLPVSVEREGRRGAATHRRLELREKGRGSSSSRVYGRSAPHARRPASGSARRGRRSTPCRTGSRTRSATPHR